MKYADREKIIANLTYESRVGFVAFCLERCFKEARRYPLASQQLEKLPLLREALEMLWLRAERGMEPNTERIRAILTHISTYEAPAPDAESVVYNFDITLVQAARVVKTGMRILLEPETATPEYVAFALEGPAQIVDLIYENGEDAQDAEVALIDTALLKLRDWGDKPFSREVFVGIPEWTRGALSKKYAENRLTGSAEDDE